MAPFSDLVEGGSPELKLSGQVSGGFSTRKQAMVLLRLHHGHAAEAAPSPFLLCRNSKGFRFPTLEGLTSAASHEQEHRCPQDCRHRPDR